MQFLFEGLSKTDKKPDKLVFSRTIRSLLVDNILNYINLTNIEINNRHLTKSVKKLMPDDPTDEPDSKADTSTTENTNDEENKKLLKDIIIDQGTVTKF